MSEVRIALRRLENNSDLPLPAFMTPGSSGMDLCAAEEKVISPGEWAAVGCGFSLALSKGFEAQIRPRSGLALKFGVTVLNAPGTIDSDYRGEVKVILINHGKHSFTVRRGDRIAQMVISRVERPGLIENNDLPPSERGVGGFGHTG